MSEKTIREQAVEAIQDGNCVVVDGVTYTLRGNPELGSKGLEELPPEEAFVGNSAGASDAVAAKLRKEVAELQARLKGIEGKEAKAEAKSEKEEAKADKKEDK